MNISVSMSYDKKKAEDIVEASLGPVAEHIAKIWVHAPSEYDVKWEADIAIFFIRIVTVANNVSKQGKLKKKWLIEKLKDTFIMTSADCAKFHDHKDYATMRKRCKDAWSAFESANKLLVPDLCALSDNLASIILESNYDSCKKIAQILASKTIEIRNSENENEKS